MSGSPDSTHLVSLVWPRAPLAPLPYAEAGVLLARMHQETSVEGRILFLLKRKKSLLQQKLSAESDQTFLSQGVQVEAGFQAASQRQTALFQRATELAVAADPQACRQAIRKVRRPTCDASKHEQPGAQEAPVFTQPRACSSIYLKFKKAEFQLPELNNSCVGCAFLQPLETPVQHTGFALEVLLSVPEGAAGVNVDPRGLTRGKRPCLLEAPQHCLPWHS